MSTPQTLPEIKNAILSDTLNVLLDASTWVRVGHSAYLYINKATAATLTEVEEDDLPQEGDLPIPFASNNIHVHCGLDGGVQKYSLVVVDATEPVYGDEPSPDDKYDMNKQVDVNVPTYIAPVEVFPSFGKEAMKKVTVALSNIPVIENAKDATIDVLQYTEPVDIMPSLGNTCMRKATVILNNVPSVETNKAATIDVTQYTEPVEVTPSSGKNCMEKATVTLSNVPVLEANKAVAIDVTQYSTPIEITPSSGINAMQKATITLNNIPAGVGINFFTDQIPVFKLDDSGAYIAVNADGTLVSNLADVPNAKFIVTAVHGGNTDVCYRKDSSSEIPHNTNVTYSNNNDFTITNGSITLYDSNAGMSFAHTITTDTMYLNNAMTSYGS